MFRGLLLAVVLTGCLSVLGEPSTADEATLTQYHVPSLGVPVKKAELDQLDYTVMPDGTGLPIGQGNANEGQKLYAEHCLRCHGIGGVDGINDRLSGGHGSLTDQQPVRTIGSYWPYATTLFDFIRRAMPYDAPGTLSHNDVYALSAYLLFENGVIDKDQAMNRQTLPQVMMPNREGFRWSEEVSDLE